MHNSLGFNAVSAMLMLVVSSAVWAQSTEQRIAAEVGVSVQLVEAKCIVVAPGSSGTKLVEGADKTWHLLYTPAAAKPSEVIINAEVGEAFDAATSRCVQPVQKRYVVTTVSDPEISPDALAKAFRILVAALVLAVLLESAFELLFNWRLFQEFFVGKAWRTPIMFAISLIIVRQFDFDPIRQLFHAYYGGSAVDKDGVHWMSSILSAMILSGGSVGINRIMANLNIRSPMPKLEQERAVLNVTEAYLSVSVSQQGDTTRYVVNLSEAPDDPAVDQILGIISAKGPGRLREMLFPTSLRVPRSGGIRVLVAKCYRISVTDLQTSIRYDMFGKELGALEEPAVVRFAPRAFVDIVIVLRKPV